MASVTICGDFGAQENKVCYCFHFSPSICHEVTGPNAMILVFWMLSFKPAFSGLKKLSSFIFIKRLFSYSSLSAILVVSSAYLRFIDISYSNPAQHFACCILQRSWISRVTRYSLDRLPIWNQSVVSCPVLTVASWPAYRFLRKQVRWSNTPIS